MTDRDIGRTIEDMGDEWMFRQWAEYWVSRVGTGKMQKKYWMSDGSDEGGWDVGGLDGSS